MKGKFVSKRSFIANNNFDKSQFSLGQIKKKRYSQSFLDLMQKAMFQLKSKQKSMERYRVKTVQSSNQSFVHGLMLSQHKRTKTTQKIKNQAFKSLGSLKSLDPPPSSSTPTNIITFTQNVQTKKIQTIQATKNIQKNEDKQIINSIRFKKSFFIQTKKSLKLQKTKRYNQTWIKKIDIKQNQSIDNSQKGIRKDSSAERDPHIKPWDINQDTEYFNKFS